MIDKKSVIIGIFAGMLLGIITAVFLAGIIINSIGESFQVDNMNITIAVNQTQLETLIRESPGYQTARADTQKHEWTGSDQDVDKLNRILSKEYDKGFINGIESIGSNILFAGSTFEYGNYTIKCQDIQPGKAFLEVIQGGNYIFNGTCYKNQWCNIRDVSIQIDDIHIGKEAAYLVYWSDRG